MADKGFKLTGRKVQVCQISSRNGSFVGCTLMRHVCILLEGCCTSDIVVLPSRYFSKICKKARKDCVYAIGWKAYFSFRVRIIKRWVRMVVVVIVIVIILQNKP